tara:strand:+ start:427 stop:1035 length:609 start_codon:yes stop_codon:yes gene_type:complete
MYLRERNILNPNLRRNHRNVSRNSINNQIIEKGQREKNEKNLYLYYKKVLYSITLKGVNTMKIKLTFWFIFIYILLIGCEDNRQKECYANHHLEIDAPDLFETNGYYQLEFLHDYTQTFSTLRANTNSTDEYQKLAWTSNKEIFIDGYWINLVNKASYTDNDGYAYTVLGVWEELIGDTIIVYCGYEDMCYHFIDSLKVIVN